MQEAVSAMPLARPTEQNLSFSRFKALTRQFANILKVLDEFTGGERNPQAVEVFQTLNKMIQEILAALNESSARYVKIEALYSASQLERFVQSEKPQEEVFEWIEVSFSTLESLISESLEASAELYQELSLKEDQKNSLQA